MAGDDVYGGDEARRRFEAALRGALKTPPRSNEYFAKGASARGKTGRLIPKDGGALVALRELRELAVGRPDVSERFVELANEGAPLFRCEIDRRAAVGTGNFVAVYKPSDDLHALLAAVRAGNGEFDNPA